MSTDEVFQMPRLAPVDVQASLAELTWALDRVYYDAEADSVAALKPAVQRYSS